MKIHKILNNNVAVILNEDGREQIVMGRGICYKKRPGEEISPEVIDKTFELTDSDAKSKFQTLIKDVPMEHVELGEAVMAEAGKRLGKNLNEMIYISLIDHIYTSIIRFLDGVTVKNVLLWDIRRFYKTEYQVGLWALARIREQFKVELPEDEAGFIALHIANAEMDEKEMHNMYEITRIMQEVLNIVKYYFHLEFDEDDVYFFRFITHLKFFAKRLTERSGYDEEDGNDLLNVIKGKYEDAYKCVEKITQFIMKKYEYNLSDEEQLYLTIHINRVITKTKK